MISVSKIMTSVVNTGVKKPLKWVSNTKLLDNVCENYRADNMKFITALGIFSILLKDGLGCYLYVKQSLNNKKIPSDKRKFVAALDLTNGGLMIGMQLLMFKTFPMKNSKKNSSANCSTNTLIDLQEKGFRLFWEIKKNLKM